MPLPSPYRRRFFLLILRAGEGGTIEGRGKGTSYLDYDISVENEEIAELWGGGFGSGEFSIDLAGVEPGETTVTITDRTTGESKEVKVTVVP